MILVNNKRRIIINSINLTILVLLLISCSKKEKIIIPEYEYNIDVKEEYSENLIDIPIIQLYHHEEYLCSMCNAGGFYDGINKFVYSWNKNNHYLKSNDLEIMFVRDKPSSVSGLRPENCYIGAKIIKNSLKAFYILWQNKGLRPINNQKKEGILKVHYNWEISEDTDSLVTNLDLKIIKKLFPYFNGNYQNIEIDTILLNYDLSPVTYDFFTDIKFINYQLGYSRNYYKLRSLLKNKQNFLP